MPGLNSRVKTVDTVLQPCANILGDDDAVVDQKAERDDHRGDRHALELYSKQAHHDDAEQHGERHEGTDDQAGAQAQKHHHHDQHDGERLIDIVDRIAHRHLDQIRLEGGVIEDVADRQFLLDLVAQGLQPLAELDVVDALSC